MSEKTEQPTAKKLRDAREKGQVAKSKDFTQTALIVALFAYIISAGKPLMESFSRIILAPFSFIDTDFHNAVGSVMEVMLVETAFLLLPFIGIVLIVGIFSETIQTGLLFAFEAIKPSAKKLNVLENAKNMVSKKSLVELLKSLIKIGVLSWVTYVLTKDALPLLMHIPYRGFAEIGTLMGEMLKNLIIQTGLAYTVIALADFVWQRMQHNKQLMMSKDEVKQEYKGMEGDPHIKGQRKHLHQELLASDSVQGARTASVLVTNPTHLAIAIRYDEDTTPLPIVVGKGEGALAERMIEAAREAGVPIVQNIPLAHALFDTSSLDQYIPSDLIEPVAAVLRLVMDLADRPSDSPDRQSPI
jgi:type III secretion protein U